MYRFSARSSRNLQGVHPDLVRVAHRALALTNIDFGVIEGLRTAARQAQLLAAGASTVQVSRHQSGHAIDVMAYVGPRGSWELPLYCEIALAFKRAALQEDVPVRWGGCWALLSTLPASADAIHDRVQKYGADRRAQGRRALIDGPHFELPTSVYG